MIVPGDVRRIVCPTEPCFDGVPCLVLARSPTASTAWWVLLAAAVWPALGTTLQLHACYLLREDERLAKEV